MTCFTTRHIQGGVRATFFNFEGAKINDSLGPPGVRPPGYAPGVCVCGGCVWVGVELFDLMAHSNAYLMQ